jgi:hypothetical protein
MERGEERKENHRSHTTEFPGNKGTHKQRDE